MSAVTVTLPLRLVSPNTKLREHWAKQAKRRAEERGITRAHLFAPLSFARTPRDSISEAWVILTRIAPRRLDSDNLHNACKSVRDGIADALGVNDNDPRVTWVYSQETAKTYGVRVHVEVRQ